MQQKQFVRKTGLSGTEEPLPAAVLAYCRTGGDIASIETLSGGMISITRRLVMSSGDRFILKQNHDAHVDLYEAEAQGLAALSASGLLRTPLVLSVGPDYLLLEDLGVSSPGETYWEAFGRALALQHITYISPRYGYHRDNYLGRLPQRNGWMTDGHTFFAERRLLRYLCEPLCEEALTARDRQNVERVASRLPLLIPPQPASLLHGDLWHGNMLVGPRGEPAVGDLAVYYGWAEAELSMVRMNGEVPEAFYSAYLEIHQLDSGWRNRLKLLHLRENLSDVAHFGDRHGSVTRLRRVTSLFV